MNPVTFHSILLGAHAEAVLDNHRGYCERLGCVHIVHAIASPDNSARTLLLYKYSTMRKVLSAAPIDALLVFADDDAVIYAPMAAPEIIGDAAHWVAESENTRRPEGNLIMLRAGPHALNLVDGILDSLRVMPEKGVDRWRYAELAHMASHPHGELLDGQHHANLLFTPFGHHLPELSAFVLSMNPGVHANVHDRRVHDVFVRYLNAVQRRGGRLFDDLEPTRPTPAYEAKNPGRPTALITSYTPNIASYAITSEQNISRYAERHNYTHHIYRKLPAGVAARMAGNWVKAELLLRHLRNHERVAWVDADILVQDSSRSVEALLNGQSVALARDISGFAFNTGFMVFSNTPECIRYLQQVQSLIDNVQDKKGVYASGGDQPFFIEAWERAGGAAAMPVLDCVSFNSHPALFDNSTFMLHYMGYPDRFRAVVMRHDDAQALSARNPVPVRKERLHFTHVMDAGHFDDIVASFRLAAEALGHETSFAVHTLDPHAINIVMFAWRVQWAALAGAHPRCIVFNFEHLTPGTYCLSESYREVLQKAYVWDYSLSNFHKNLSLGFRVADYVPLGYQPGAGTEQAAGQALPEAQKDIDVLFFGGTTARRLHILNALVAKGVKVVSPAHHPWTNEERDAHLLRAKVVLNMHQFDDSRIVEVPRLTILLRQRKAVVCELYPDSDIEPTLREAVEGAPYDLLVDTTLNLLQNPVRRAALERIGSQRLVARSQTDRLAPALDRYFQWLRQQKTQPPHQTPSPSARHTLTLGLIHEEAGPAHLAAFELPGRELMRILVVPAGRSAAPDGALTTVSLPGKFSRARARAAVLSLSASDYVAYVSPDETDPETRLARQSRFLDDHPEIDIVGCWWEQAFEKDPVQIHCAPELDHEIRAELLGTRRVLRERTCLYRRAFVQRDPIAHEPGFDSDRDDQYFLHRCVVAGARLAVIPEPLCRTPAPATIATDELGASEATAVRELATLLAGFFPHLAESDVRQLAQLRAAYWPPDAEFASAMISLLARVAETAATHARLETATLSRTFRQEAVRLIERYRDAGLIDIRTINQFFTVPATAHFLAPARDQLIA